MKGRNSLYILLFLLAGSTSLLNSCGLKYEPPVSDITLEMDRRGAMEAQLLESYKAIGIVYKPMAYGDMTVIKPNSYRRLDSLYNIKYNNRGNTEVLNRLEPEIETQLAIVQNDTTKVLYQETHWFQLDDDSITSEFITALVRLDKRNILTDVQHVEQITVKGNLRTYAYKYYKEDGFLNYGYITDEERNFYSFYKEKAQTLVGPAKDTFLLHTFRTMQLAQQIGSLYTQNLLSRMALNELNKGGNTYIETSLNINVNEISTSGSQGNVFQNYQVKIALRGEEKKEWVFNYDAYLQRIE